MKLRNISYLLLPVILLGGARVIAAKEKPDPKENESWKESVQPVEERFSASGRNRHFILELGYQLVLEGKEGRKTIALAITVLDETKKVGDVETRVVEERETADGKLVEVSRNYFAVGAQSHNV
jgi:hypothetical protein